MDYANENSSSRPLEWRGDDYLLQRDALLGVSQCLWDEKYQNEENLFCMLDETTPVKACLDFDYRIIDNDGNMNKELEECGAPSQLKRRRMLQFSPHAADPYICNEQAPSAFVNSEDGENSLTKDGMHGNMEWGSIFSEDRCISSTESLGQPADVWVEDYLNDNVMDLSSDEMNVSGASDDQVGFSESCNVPAKMEANALQQPASPAPCSLFKVKSGRKTYMQTPTKLVTSVAYPFALIKPCGVKGDVTLKDINQRIHTPPPSILKHKDEDLLPSYPTSAFSGKPVVLKTKIRTEGGKGSITIMRTKG